MLSKHSALRRAYMTRYRDAAERAASYHYDGLLIGSSGRAMDIVSWAALQRMSRAYYNEANYYRDKIAAIDKHDREYFG